jgi:predicted DNA-binding transcriptional regulator AlpA
VTDENNTVYGSITTLATRWGVSLPTARNHTHSSGFPPALALGERSARWLMEEVQQWEQRKRTPARRVVTGT